MILSIVEKIPEAILADEHFLDRSIALAEPVFGVDVRRVEPAVDVYLPQLYRQDVLGIVRNLRREQTVSVEVAARPPTSS